MRCDVTKHSMSRLYLIGNFITIFANEILKLIVIVRGISVLKIKEVVSTDPVTTNHKPADHRSSHGGPIILWWWWG